VQQGTTRFGLMLVLGVAVAGQMACSGAGSITGDGAAVMTQARQQEMSPEDVLEDLHAGNERFTASGMTDRDWMAQARATADGQYPKAVVLTCVDSRVPPEVVFDQGIGDIFVGRVAGNFENTDLLGSMEFATKLAGSKAIVVLGHTSCGAVKGAVQNVEMGNLTAMLENLRPAVEAARASDASLSDAELVERVVEVNVEQTVRDIRAQSPIIDQMVRAGDLRVVGAIYDLETGAVRWLDGGERTMGISTHAPRDEETPSRHPS